MQARGVKKLILSIEPLPQARQNFKPAVRVLTLEELKGGFKHTFVVPQSSEVINAGLYLCEDDTSSGSCWDKESEDFATVMTNAGAAKGRLNAQLAGRDKVFYFQYLLLRSQVLTTAN